MGYSLPKSIAAVTRMFNLRYVQGKYSLTIRVLTQGLEQKRSLLETDGLTTEVFLQPRGADSGSF